MKKLFLPVLACVAVTLTCRLSFDDGMVEYDGDRAEKRAWTFIVYMAADNDLEPAAIADFNEMEAVSLPGRTVSVLVLLDRIEGYDATNGNWTDTRLYEVQNDSGGNNATIVSRRLDCPELGLSASGETELDMADPLVLSRVINYAKRAYPANHYGLLMWGHGTGWRGGQLTEDKPPEPLKAVAVDDTAGHYMTLRSLGSAVSGKGLSVAGFDTCFGGLLEVAYQLKDDAEYLIASEGIIPSSGWDYEQLFTAFAQNVSLSPVRFCDAAIDQFRAQYGGTNGTILSAIYLPEIPGVFTALESFGQNLALGLTTGSARDTAADAVLNTVDRYCFTSFPSELYVDLYSFSEEMMAIRGSITGDTARQNAINAAGQDLQAALNAAIYSSWSQRDGITPKGLGIFMAPLNGPVTPGTPHDPAYMKGSTSMSRSAFVEASEHWVPHATARADSFLDKMFYWVY